MIFVSLAFIAHMRQLGRLHARIGYQPDGLFRVVGSVAHIICVQPIGLFRVGGSAPQGNPLGSPDIIERLRLNQIVLRSSHTLSLRGRRCLIPSGHGMRRDSGGCRGVWHGGEMMR